MVLCDDVIEYDEEVAAFDLIGVRTAMVASTIPTVYSLCVFAQMSGHRGEAACFVEIEHAESGDVVAETEPMVIQFEDPTVAVPLSIHLTNCVFTSPGLYYVQIYHESKLIGERRFDVRLGE